MMERMCSEMQVVVLMGGRGTRLGIDKPKSMVSVEGMPFFRHQLELMIQAGFKNFVFCVGYGADMIEKYFGSGRSFGYGVNITYSRDGDKPLGTGGAIKNALPLLANNFMVIYGDSFMDVNYFEIVLKYHSEFANGRKALMTIMRNKDNRYGDNNVEYCHNQIISYSKSPNNTNKQYIDYGISIFHKSCFDFIEKESFDLTEVFQHLIYCGFLGSHIIYNRFYEIGTPAALQEFKDYAQHRWRDLNKAIFLDRDGIIDSIIWNDNIEQLDSPLSKEQVELIPGVVQGLRKLQSMGYLLFIVTNQPAAAKGKTTYLQLCEVNSFIIELLRRYGVYITGYELCPHYPKININTKENYLIQDCICRKPKPGMVYNIMSKYNISHPQSWMVGDAYTDILCGQHAYIKTAFIGSYKCDTCALLDHKKPDLICKNLLEFADKLGELYEN